MDDTTFDFAIVGGGVTGLAFALALRDYPGRVVLLEPDRAAAGADRRRLALSPASCSILRDLGVWDALAGKARVIREMRLSEQGVFGAANIHARDAGLDALAFVVPFGDFHQALAARLDEAGCCQVVPQAATAMSRGDGDMRLALGDGSVVAARRVAVCGGRACVPLARAAGFAYEEADYRQNAVVFPVEAERDEPDVTYERFTPQGVLAALPDGGRRRMIVWLCETELAEALMEMSAERLLDELRAHFGRRLGRLRAPGKCVSYPLKLLLAKQMTRGRVILLGDCAHTLHPVGGQSFNLTLRDVATLAETLRAAPHDADDQPDVRGWERRRIADIRRTALTTDLMARMFLRRWRFLAPFHSAAFVALGAMPSLRRRLIQHALGGHPPWPRGVADILPGAEHA